MNWARRFQGPRLLALAVALVALLVYLPALANGFAYDDVVIITGDPRVKEFQLQNILLKPYWSSPGFALYRPLVTMSFAADWALSSGSPAWFHAVNVLWHALASVAVFLLLLAWFRPAWSALGALLFAVHPVHVEAVANVVGRAEVMAGALVLSVCALWAHGWPRSRVARFALAALLFLLALLCKESAAVLPGFLVLIDASRWRSLRELPAYLRQRWPELSGFALLLTGSLILRARFAGGLVPTELDPIMEVVTAPDQRILTALQVWPEIIRLFVFPWTLLADYGPHILLPANGLQANSVLGLVIVVASVAGGLAALNRGRGLLGLALLWVPLAFLPVANLIMPIGVILAERTLYVPSLVCALGLSGAAFTLARRRQWRGRIAVGCALLLLAFSVRTVLRIPDWDSTDAILMAQLRDRPDSFRAHWHAARMQRRLQAVRPALQHYARAVELWPYRERLVVEAAAYAGTQAQTGMALRLARHGAGRWPRNAELQRLLASNALDLGDTATARSAMVRGLQLAPGDQLLRRMAAALGEKP